MYVFEECKMLLKEYNYPPLSLLHDTYCFKAFRKICIPFFPSIGCAGSLLGHVGFSLWCLGASLVTVYGLLQLWSTGSVVVAQLGLVDMES